MKKLSDKSKSNLPVRQKTRALAVRRQYLMGLLAVLTLATALALSSERNRKKLALIAKVLREHFTPVCEQYALTARNSDYYPCFECENGQIFLKEDEVWRYGFTGEGGRKARYPSGTYYKDDKWNLTSTDLEYIPQLRSVRWRCLIEEIIKIFDYPELPEAQARDIQLIRPPGNKQDR